MSDPVFSNGDKVKFYDYNNAEGIVITVGEVLYCFSDGIHYDSSKPYYAVQAIDLEGNTKVYPSLSEERLFVAAEDEVTRYDSENEDAPTRPGMSKTVLEDTSDESQKMRVESTVKTGVSNFINDSASSTIELTLSASAYKK